jgi:hypothetical protein
VSDLAFWQGSIVQSKASKRRVSICPQDLDTAAGRAYLPSGTSDQDIRNLLDVSRLTIRQIDKVDRRIGHELPRALERPLPASLKVLFGDIGRSAIPGRCPWLSIFGQEMHVAVTRADQVRDSSSIAQPSGADDRVHDRLGPIFARFRCPRHAACGDVGEAVATETVLSHVERRGIGFLSGCNVCDRWLSAPVAAGGDYQPITHSMEGRVPTDVGLLASRIG